MRVIETSVSPETPKGSKFIIESYEFGSGSDLIEQTIELKKGIDEAKLYDWPVVYILTNDKEAYVGQTTSAINRMEQHNANPSKQMFRQTNIIFNEEANASVITDYENRLIQLMGADGKFQLTNKNAGMENKNYFSKAVYGKMFEELWEDLRRLEYADKALSEIEDSEIFKYSPFKNLNSEQRFACKQILDAIETNVADEKPIVVKGLPGTGKTVLAIYLLKALKDNPEYEGLNIRLLEPQPNLRNTLRKAVEGIRNLSKTDIIGPADLVNPKYGYKQGSKYNFDIVLIDEAHKLKQRKAIPNQGQFKTTSLKLGIDEYSSQLDWVLDQVKCPIFFYDQNQVIAPSGIYPEIAATKIGDAFDNPLMLMKQMRVSGGDAYLDYVRQLLNGEDPSPISFDDYEFVLHDEFSNFFESFNEKISKNSLTRLLAGYAWSWESKSDKTKTVTDIHIDGIDIRWNSSLDDWVGKGLDDCDVAHEAGCVHSIQGYDLSYAYVIIGPDLKYNPITNELYADKSNYYDKKGKETTSPEKLLSYLQNIYYVLMTRGVFGTHLYVCDLYLRTYLSNYIKVV